MACCSSLAKLESDGGAWLGARQGHTHGHTSNCHFPMCSNDQSHSQNQLEWHSMSFTSRSVHLYNGLGFQVAVQFPLAGPDGQTKIMPCHYWCFCLIPLKILLRRQKARLDKVSVPSLHSGQMLNCIVSFPIISPELGILIRSQVSKLNRRAPRNWYGNETEVPSFIQHSKPNQVKHWHWQPKCGWIVERKIV